MSNIIQWDDSIFEKPVGVHDDNIFYICDKNDGIPKIYLYDYEGITCYAFNKIETKKRCKMCKRPLIKCYKLNCDKHTLQCYNCYYVVDTIHPDNCNERSQMSSILISACETHTV